MSPAVSHHRYLCSYLPSAPNLHAGTQFQQGIPGTVWERACLSRSEKLSADGFGKCVQSTSPWTLLEASYTLDDSAM